MKILFKQLNFIEITLHFALEGSKRAKYEGYYLMENFVLIEYIEKFLEIYLKKKEMKFEKNIE